MRVRTKGTCAAAVLGALVATLATPTAAAADPRQTRVSFRVVARGLVQPVALAGSKDGTSRLFIAERAGRIRVYRHRLLAGSYLDIRDRVNSAGGEQGLLGLAFHPRFKTNRYFYVAYTASSGALRVSRFRAPSYAHPRVARSSERVILSIPHPGRTNHNGGQIAFNRDGYLYVGTGDGGGGGDPDANAQNRTRLLGKILRINVNRSCAGRPYCVPGTNPYARHATYRREIWAYGLRNPWRFSFDRANGNLYIGDVGQGAREEVDRAPYRAGGYNFGWNCYEGRLRFAGGSCLRNVTYRFPLRDYGRSLGSTVIGGHVYRGAPYPALRGIYVYGDFASGRVWGYAGGVNAQMGTFPGALVSFGENSSGYLFALGYDGRMFRVIGQRR